MNTMEKTMITIETTVNVPVSQAWKIFNSPEHVTQWNHASDDWHSPHAENDLRPGGNFKYRMEAKDGSFGFDFGGVYTAVEENKMIRYTMGDGREVEVLFTEDGKNRTHIKETFDAENMHDPEMQKNGWQAILNNFRDYAESVATS